MSLSTSINTISAATMTYAPVALAAIASVEAADAAIPGITKSQIATNFVMAAAQAGEGVPIPEVSEVSAMIALFVGFFNATGIFHHKTKAVAPVAA